MTIDNRMLWIRNLDMLDAAESTIRLNYEVTSEKDISGLLSYESDKIRFHCATRKNKSDSNSLYYLNIKVPDPLVFNESKQYTKKGYYLMSGLAGEMTLLLGLFFRAFFNIDAVIYNISSDYPVRIDLDKKKICNAKKENREFSFLSEVEYYSKLDDFEDILDMVRGLPTNKHHKFVLSLQNYSESLYYMPYDGELSYIKLVSAIEVLSSGFRLDEKDDLKHINKVIDYIENIGQDEELDEYKVLLSHRKSQLKFIRFIEQYSEGFFEQKKDEKHNNLYLSVEKLQQILKRIYRARSNYLHGGQKMYISRYSTLWSEYDFDPSIGLMIDKKKFDNNEKLPLVSSFELLVRYCLLKYLEENSSVKF